MIDVDDKIIQFDPSMHAYFVEGKRYPCVSDVLREFGFYNSEIISEDAIWRGTLAHKAIAYFLKGTLDWDTVNPLIEPYVRAVEKFLADSGFKPAWIEKRGINQIYKFAGTIDAFGHINQRPTLVDWKTGQIGSWSALQLAGYQTFFGYPVRRLAVELRKNGKYHVERFDDVKEPGLFCSLVSAYYWKVNNKYIKLEEGLCRKS